MDHENKPIEDDEIEPDFAGHDQFIATRHTTEPTAEHIEGPYWSEYPAGRDGEFRYLLLSIEWGEYIIPVENLIPPEGEDLWDVQRVLWHDDRVRLEVHLDDSIVLMTEAGMTQREHPFWDEETLDEPIENPDAVLWDRG